MQTISTTELRTKSKELVLTLSQGNKVYLIHRSRIVGVITPKIEDPKPIDPEKFAQALKGLNLPHIPLKKREQIYRQHLEEKYGKAK